MTAPPARRGLLIAIEGIDGAGKTTLQRSLARRWRQRGIPVVRLTEPSHGPSGRRARRLAGRDPWTAARAFTEDRRQQRPSVLRWLDAGRVVLADRSFYSTLAYQGSALPPKRRAALRRAQRRAAIRPDRVLLLSLPVRDALARIPGRTGRPDPTQRFEVTAVLARVARAYRQMSRSRRWVVLDARATTASVLARADRALYPWVRAAVRPGPRPRA